MKKTWLSMVMLSSFFLMAYAQSDSSDSITITTYYPSPYGVYGQMQTYTIGVGDTNGDGVFNNQDVPAKTARGTAWLEGPVGIGTNDTTLHRLVIKGKHHPSGLDRTVAVYIDDTDPSGTAGIEFFRSKADLDNFSTVKDCAAIGIGSQAGQFHADPGDLGITALIDKDIHFSTQRLVGGVLDATRALTIKNDGSDRPDVWMSGDLLFNATFQGPPFPQIVSENEALRFYKRNDPGVEKQGFKFIKYTNVYPGGTQRTLAHINDEGNLILNGTLTENYDFSDARLKKNIRPIAGALKSLLRLRGVNFQWKEPENFSDRTGVQAGFIAQEVEQVFPEWVSTVEGSKVIHTIGFEALAVESFRELKRENEALRRQIESLRSEVKRLRK